jgi:hypothetical protein
MQKSASPVAVQNYDPLVNTGERSPLFSIAAARCPRCSLCSYVRECVRSMDSFALRSCLQTAGWQAAKRVLPDWVVHIEPILAAEKLVSP